MRNGEKIYKEENQRNAKNVHLHRIWEKRTPEGILPHPLL